MLPLPQSRTAVIQSTTEDASQSHLATLYLCVDTWASSPHRRQQRVNTEMVIVFTSAHRQPLLADGPGVGGVAAAAAAA